MDGNQLLDISVQENTPTQISVSGSSSPIPLNAIQDAERHAHCEPKDADCIWLETSMI